MAISLEKEKRERAIKSIRQYFAENMDEEVGDLKASLLLDFFLEEIGGCVYNKAVADAQAFFQEKVADLEGARYEPEFAHWK
jgi:uncharacterized protein (DUF2164 family)